MAIPTSSAGSNLDSLLFQLAELFAFELEFFDSAVYYHKEVVKSYFDSKFRPGSLIYLSEKFPEANWSKLLLEDYPDTTFKPDFTFHNSIYLAEIFQVDFAVQQETIIKNCELYLELFSDPMDSGIKDSEPQGIALDSLVLYTDSTDVQIDSESLHQTLQKEKEELTP